MAVEPSKLEAMMVHLLNERGPTGKPWAAIAVPGYPRFTRADADVELAKLRQATCDDSCKKPVVRWWEFWKR
jgi:hypothetical protein